MFTAWAQWPFDAHHCFLTGLVTFGQLLARVHTSRRAAQSVSRWKSHRAGVRALRYIFFCAPPHAPLGVNDCQFALGFESANLRA
jgi:hypothetical protein